MTGYLHHVLPCQKAPNHGIWQFSEKLASKLREQVGTHSEFSSWSKRNVSDTDNLRDSHAVQETRRKILSRSHTEKPVALLLHFDYGSYGWWDLPLWLCLDLISLKRAAPTLQLITFCHEMPPPAPRRRRERLLLPLSRRIFKLLLRVSDHVYCSNPWSLQQVKAIAGISNVSWRPMFSNIGEPVGDEFLQRKNPQEWVLFGSAGNLPRYLRSLKAEFRGLPPAIAPRSLNIVGGGNSSEVQAGIQALRQDVSDIRHSPSASEAECSDVFKRSGFCFLKYFETHNPEAPELLLKSGVFAAAGAHGTIPIIAHEGWDRFKELTGHPAGVWKKNGQWLEFPESRDVSKRLFDWYQAKSSLDGMARMIAGQLRAGNPDQQIISDVSLSSTCP